MSTKFSSVAAMIILNLIGTVSQCSAADNEPRARTVRPDKSQPWLKANRFSVETAGAAPKISIRFANEHATRVVENMKGLGAGTARDDHGHEYKAYSLRMIDSLEPQKSHTAEFSFLPKLTSKTSTLLVLLHALEERVVYVKLLREEEGWKIEEYGTWPEKTAYRKQDDWASERKKKNPYKEAAAAVRQWSDDSGDFSVKASFVDFKLDRTTGKGIVYLKRADDGTTIDVEHQRLSAADQKYIRELKKIERESDQD